MLEVEVLILEGSAIDGLAASSVAVREVAPLYPSAYTSVTESRSAPKSPELQICVCARARERGVRARKKEKERAEGGRACAREGGKFVFACAVVGGGGMHVVAQETQREKTDREARGR